MATMQCEDGRQAKLVWDKIDGCYNVQDTDHLTEWEERALCHDKDLPGWSVAPQPAAPVAEPKPARRNVQGRWTKIGAKAWAVCVDGRAKVGDIVYFLSGAPSCVAKVLGITCFNQYWVVVDAQSPTVQRHVEATFRRVADSL